MKKISILFITLVIPALVLAQVPQNPEKYYIDAGEPISQAPQQEKEKRDRLTIPLLTIPAQPLKTPEKLPEGVSAVDSFVYLKPTDPKLVSWRNDFYDGLKKLEDAGKLYVESGKPLPDGFLTMHTARDGWRINFLRMPANLHVSRRPRIASPILPSSPAQDFLRQIQSSPPAMPVAPVPSTGGLGGPAGGGGGLTSAGGPLGTLNDFIAKSPAGKGDISFYGEMSLYKTYSSDIMLPFLIDGQRGFVFNFNALQNTQLTASGERRGQVYTGMPGTDLAMTFEPKLQGDPKTFYTYVLFYRLVRVGDEIIKQKITYEQFMEYGEKMGYWEQGWGLGGKRWELNPNDWWKNAK